MLIILSPERIPGRYNICHYLHRNINSFYLDLCICAYLYVYTYILFINRIRFYEILIVYIYI